MQIPPPEDRGKYDWTDQLDGNWYLAEGGVHFKDVTAGSYGQFLRYWCKKNGYKAELLSKHSASRTGFVKFRIYHDPAPSAAGRRTLHAVRAAARLDHVHRHLCAGGWLEYCRESCTRCMLPDRAIPCDGRGGPPAPPIPPGLSDPYTDHHEET